MSGNDIIKVGTETELKKYIAYMEKDKGDVYYIIFDIKDNNVNELDKDFITSYIDVNNKDNNKDNTDPNYYIFYGTYNQKDGQINSFTN